MKTFNPTHDDIRRLAYTHELPFCIAEKIFSIKRIRHDFWGSHHEEHFSKKEYDLMLLGAAIAYRNQCLLGRAIPLNDPRAIELATCMLELGITCQYHPDFGMQIVEDERAALATSIDADMSRIGIWKDQLIID